LCIKFFFRYFELDFSDKSEAFTKGDYITFFTFMLWVFISSFTGGCIAYVISKRNGYSVARILSGIGIILLLILVIPDMGSFDLSALVIFLVLTAMAIAGFHAGAALIIRKRRKKSSVISNTPSSPPGNP
jgi:hypothetical protein